MTHAALSYTDAHSLLPRDAALTDAIARVADLDFSMLRRKLVEESGWTEERTVEVEDLYRKFLALNVRFQDQKICPTGPIDEFWHAHILDTQAYAADCDRLFGRMLHHFPYFGMRGPSDREDLERTFTASVELFVTWFGVDPTIGDTAARSCRPQKCP